MREKKSDSAPKPHAPCFGAAEVPYTRERAAHHPQNALHPAAKPGANGTAESAGRRHAVLAPPCGTGRLAVESRFYADRPLRKE